MAWGRDSSPRQDMNGISVPREREGKCAGVVKGMVVPSRCRKLSAFGRTRSGRDEAGSYVPASAPERCGPLEPALSRRGAGRPALIERLRSSTASVPAPQCTEHSPQGPHRANGNCNAPRGLSAQRVLGVFAC